MDPAHGPAAAMFQALPHILEQKMAEKPHPMHPMQLQANAPETAPAGLPGPAGLPMPGAALEVGGPSSVAHRQLQQGAMHDCDCMLLSELEND